METRETITKVLVEITGVKDLKLDVPENSEFGDYSSNVAMTTFENAKTQIPNAKWGNPGQYAQELAEKLKNDDKLMAVVEKIEIAGLGFINFFLKKENLIQNLEKINTVPEKYGCSSIGTGKTVVIDYSAPNIAKRFSIGHLRSTIIGQALYNIYNFLGYKTIGDNHLGDWGTQFGKLLYMIKRESVPDFDIEKLERLYVAFHEEAAKNPEIENEARNWFKKLEEGDKEAREIWEKCKDISLSEFNRIYSRLGVEIDYAYGESFYEDKMKDLVAGFENGRLKGLEIGEDGAKIIDLREFGINVPLMFLKSDGTTTYATRDLATLDLRQKKWNPQVIIYEVGAEQTLHFSQVFAAGKKLGLVSDKVVLHHTKHGLYLGTDGKKFRTRSGSTVKLEEVLDEAVEKAKKIISKSETSRGFSKEEVNKLSEVVGIGAIKYFDLMHAPQSDIVFDWDKVVNMEGNSGPYLQYTFARTQSVIAKAKNTNHEIVKKIGEINSDELSVLRHLVHFPEVVAEAGEKYAPNLICNYLYELAKRYNSFYNSTKIIGGENEPFDLSLTSATGTVLKSGLSLLGIQAPDKM